MTELKFKIKRPSTGKYDLGVSLTEDYAKDINLRDLQNVIYTMLGESWLGSFAVEQPADFYIDSRVGKLPYPKKVIERAVEILAFVAKAQGKDPHHLIFNRGLLPWGWILEN